MNTMNTMNTMHTIHWRNMTDATHAAVAMHAARWADAVDMNGRIHRISLSGGTLQVDAMAAAKAVLMSTRRAGRDALRRVRRVFVPTLTRALQQPLHTCSHATLGAQHGIRHPPLPRPFKRIPYNTCSYHCFN